MCGRLYYGRGCRCKLRLLAPAALFHQAQDVPWGPRENDGFRQRSCVQEDRDTEVRSTGDIRRINVDIVSEGGESRREFLFVNMDCFPEVAARTFVVAAFLFHVVVFATQGHSLSTWNANRDHVSCDCCSGTSGRSYRRSAVIVCDSKLVNSAPSAPRSPASRSRH